MSNTSKIKHLLEEAWRKRREEKYKDAHAVLTEAYALCDEDDYNSLGRVFHVYMQFDYDQGNLHKALELCLKSLEYYTKAGNPDRIAHSTRHIADLQCHIGRYADSESNYRKAISIYKNRQQTHAGDLANALRGFAVLLEKRKKTETAITAWMETRELYQACNLQAGVDEASERLVALLAQD